LLNERDSLYERLSILMKSKHDQSSVDHTKSTTIMEDEEMIQQKIIEQDRVIGSYAEKIKKEDKMLGTCRLGVDQLRRILKVGEEIG
jgi:hypothetical protein